MWIGKSIYNLGQKEEYLDYVDDKGSMRNLFYRIAQKEEEYNKDIADMSKEEVIDTLKSLGLKTRDYRGQVISLFRKYADWAKVFNKTNDNSVMQLITPASIGDNRAFKLEMIKSPEHMADIIERGTRDAQGENRRIIMQLVLSLLYEGMIVSEIVLLEKGSLNNNGVVSTQRGIYHLNDEISKLWEQCASIEEVEVVRRRQKTMVLVQNNFLIRNVRDVNEDETKPYLPQGIYTIVKKVNKTYSNYIKEKDLKLTPMNISVSGVYYKMLIREREGIVITPEITADNFKIPYSSQENKASVSSRFTNYIDWKVAFDHI